MFSIYLTTSVNYKGMLTFGNYDVKKFAKSGMTDDDIFWADLATNKYYWTVHMEKMKLGDSLLGIQTTNLILDSGMSFAIIPMADHSILIQHFKREFNIDF